MISKIIKPVVMTIALLLMATYMFLNSQKLATLSAQWADFKAGSLAVVASIKLADETVYQHALKTSDIFDATGKRQVVIMPVPKSIYTKIAEQAETARLIIGEQDVSLDDSADKTALLATTQERKIYLVANDALKPMMTVIWNEQRQARTIVRCVNREMCASLKVSSRDWGPVQGPFSESDFSVTRRGLPRGRWARGPRTLLSIQSRTEQKVRLQINLLAVHSDQEISFRGAASGVKKMDTESKPIIVAGRTLYLAAYVLELDLKAGGNGLEMNYSIWDKAATEGANPLAAFITTIGFSNLAEAGQASDQGP
jgi:hypothetical protein